MYVPVQHSSLFRSRTITYIDHSIISRYNFDMVPSTNPQTYVTGRNCNLSVPSMYFFKNLIFIFTKNLSIAKLTVIKAEDFHEKSEKTNIAYTTEINVQRPLLKTINFTNNRKNRKFFEMVDRTNLNFHP